MWFDLREKKLELSIFVKPNAKKTAVIGVDEQYIHIAIHAKPKGGEANRELLNFLAKYLNVPKTQMVMLRGEHSRYKTIIISLATLNDIKYEKIRALLQLNCAANNAIIQR